jgi:hypothetical protein
MAVSVRAQIVAHFALFFHSAGGMEPDGDCALHEPSFPARFFATRAPSNVLPWGGDCGHFSL